jgi:hypothetical protein
MDHYFEPDGKGFSLCRRCGRERTQHSLDVPDSALRATLEVFRSTGKPEDDGLIRRTEAEIERRRSDR